LSPDLLGPRLAAREWIVTVEVVTPPPADAAAHDRILTLADAVRGDARVAGLALTDRTAAPDADPVSLAPEVAARAGKSPLVHLAGKGRDARALTAILERAGATGVRAVLLTGGDASERRMDPADGDARRDRMPSAGRDVTEARMDAVDMLALARTVAPDLLRLAVLEPAPGRPLEAAWDRAAAKRDAGAAAMVAQVTWDVATREALAEWQARLGVPMLGAVMLLTRSRLAFLAQHRIGGIVVPPALRRRVADQAAGEGMRRLALDLVLLRRLGYAGAHVSGLLSPGRVAEVLDEAARLDAVLGADWREVWREAAGIA
jgi:methylenetetrahydrofolate reductase (NADPH)